MDLTDVRADGLDVGANFSDVRAVAQAIQFDEEGITRVVANINELVAQLPAAMPSARSRRLRRKR